MEACVQASSVGPCFSSVDLQGGGGEQEEGRGTGLRIFAPELRGFGKRRRGASGTGPSGQAVGSLSGSCSRGWPARLRGAQGYASGD